MTKIFSHIKKPEHAALWLFMWLFIFDYYYHANNLLQAIAYTTLEIVTYAAIVYLNLLLLIPFFLKKGFILLYILSVLIAIAGYILLIRLSGLEILFYEYGGWRNVFSMFLNSSLFMLLSLLYWYFKQWQLEREKQLILKSEKLEAELNFLRTQLNPHFIFNTLNNIYSLSLQKHDNAAPMIANLSSILRYTLYEGGDGHVNLENEINALKRLIDLYLMAKPKSMNVLFLHEGDCRPWEIVPMLLMNFAENCFKHSNINIDSSGFIKINSKIMPDGKFVFITENSWVPAIAGNKNGGIGLQNAMRQLEINYPNAHSLETKIETGTYTTTLTMQLQKV